MIKKKPKFASQHYRKIGSATSEKKKAACRLNGAKGGRPKAEQVFCLECGQRIKGVKK